MEIENRSIQPSSLVEPMKVTNRNQVVENFKIGSRVIPSGNKIREESRRKQNSGKVHNSDTKMLKLKIIIAFCC